MTRMQRVVLEGLIGGTLSSVLSAVLLCAAGRRQTGSPYAAVNAISHWLWKDRAFRRNAPSLRYTGTGYLIHHLASTFWATGHAAVRSPGSAADARAAIAGGLATSALACFVDYRLTPHRLQPGFEQRLSRPALTGVYLAFGVGIAVGAWLLSPSPRPTRGIRHTSPRNRKG
ncbi:MAG: hypothetical protein JZU45_05700 [Methyloversatilis discipulorum]|uniref:hypothetical protein n=1 Tax=Methyloversatilis discipulorum TaxID=1119528 RepID=UPI0026E9749F|nr:hypothetical protein [Methyloversatilis discipulorum]MBV5285556.1 hypothetical protein [Methyloversatilis discipulorum]